MKKIGIITYHHYYNYGTMLQAFALQKKIEKIGYNAELIDYQQNSHLTKLQLIKIRIKRMPVYLANFKKYSILSSNKSNLDKKAEKFEDFYSKELCVAKEKYIELSQLFENTPVYDGYIVGSDQTWNPNMKDFLEANLLSFVSDSSKKGCYAPSIAVNSFSAEEEKYFREKLLSFSYLSCREKDGAKLLEKITGKSVEHVLDPTLLLNREEWSEFFKFNVPQEPYILVYFLGEKKWHRKKVEELRKVTGWKVISLPISHYEMANKNYQKVWGGPEEFLSLINGAKLVCTDSFHGTIFSINFGKNFYSFCKHDDSEGISENSRLYSILDMLNLRNRIIKKDDVLSVSNIEIDYTKVYDCLNREREKSEKYLETMLQEITKEKI